MEQRIDANVLSQQSQAADRQFGVEVVQGAVQ
jgi:hypothetical protein